MTRSLLFWLAVPALAVAACSDEDEARSACELLHDRCPPTTVFISSDDTDLLNRCEQRSASASNEAEVAGCLEGASDCSSALACARRLK